MMKGMILVTGATGLTGHHLVQRLSARGVPVRALVRNSGRAQLLVGLPNVEPVIGDMSRPETLIEALRGVDRAMLISTSNAEMLNVQVSFIDAARTAGVQYIVKLSGIISAVDSDFRFARMHGLAERHLEASGMAFTHLRAGEFMHSYFRQVENIVERGILALPMEDARIASIETGDLAEVASIVLTSGGHEGKTYPLTGSEALTMAELAQKLSAATGREIRYVNVPPEDARQAQVANGMPPDQADALYELFAERRKGMESTVYPTLEDVFGLRPTTFDEFAQRHAAAFRGEEPPPRN